MERSLLTFSHYRKQFGNVSGLEKSIKDTDLIFWDRTWGAQYDKVPEKEGKPLPDHILLPL